MGILNLLFSKDESQDEPARALAGRPGGEYPFFIKAPMVLLGLSLFVYILIVLRDVLVPICFAALIAILLNPIVNRLIRWRLHKAVSIAAALLLTALVFAGILLFISSQLINFSELLPQFKQNGQQVLGKLQTWVENTFNYPKAKQLILLKGIEKDIQSYLTGMLTSFLGILGVLVLLPIYTFLILYYKPLFLNFFYEVFERRHGEKVADVLSETKNAIQKYVTGLLIEMLIVATLNSTALLLIGVRYAILLGVIGAILNLIPYIGGIVAILLPVIISLVDNSGSMTTPLLVLGSYLVVQFIDNNFLVPRIVSSKVDVNAFISIVIVLMGGAMWGTPGMFLSIPIIAICKIVFDRVKPLRPWGKVLGVKIEEPPPVKVVNENDARQANDEPHL